MQKKECRTDDSCQKYQLPEWIFVIMDNDKKKQIC